MQQWQIVTQHAPVHIFHCIMQCLEINPEYSLKVLMLKLKLLIFWPPDLKCWLFGKEPDAGKDWRQETGVTEDEMVGWHHWLNGHEFEQAPGHGEGQGSLACCGPWCCKELDMAEWLNNKSLCFVKPSQDFFSYQILSSDLQNLLPQDLWVYQGARLLVLTWRKSWVNWGESATLTWGILASSFAVIKNQ